ncbi:F-actin-capping protein subunit alpha [Lachnellula arida]|uniref:F-actin-capping protein subunit alpha n=1 Tax=Lachnellula arida TaxID=1316785 RepID=A0A8T9BI17_9HELO|nr:F-actin-capping protein subunit alpha [Lachnellula arida]
MASPLATVSSFVEGAPPGEMLLPVLLPPAILELFTEAISLDIKALTIDTPSLASQLGPAFEKYNEEQFATVKLPGSSQSVSSLLQGTGI